MSGHKRVFFLLEQDENGYPPISAESVWAREEGEGRLILDNIPFFATQATIGDLIKAELEDGELKYVSTLQHSGNSLIRVAYHKSIDPTVVRDRLAALGCSTEWLAAYSLIAVNVPPEVDLRDVQDFLRRGMELDQWDYEEPLLLQ